MGKDTFTDIPTEDLHEMEQVLHEVGIPQDSIMFFGLTISQLEKSALLKWEKTFIEQSLRLSPPLYRENC
jgi:hypothetical protein